MRAIFIAAVTPEWKPPWCAASETEAPIPRITCDERLPGQTFGATLGVNGIFRGGLIAATIEAQERIRIAVVLMDHRVCGIHEKKVRH